MFGLGSPGGFSRESLAIELLARGTVWRPGDAATGNLNGTLTSLDCYSTPDQCVAGYRAAPQLGLLSRDGWALIDDTATARFAAAPAGLDPPIAWYNDTVTSAADWYFFGGAASYEAVLADYRAIAGPIALPPLSALGVWWSRYYAYSETQLVAEVLDGYASNKLPLNQLVCDMDWHIEPTDKTCPAWGGFTWNTSLFANPDNFTSWLASDATPQKHPLPLLLNVHPATGGVDHCQEQYAAVATAVGIDPSTKQNVECDLGNPKFVSALFGLVLNTGHLEGVSYWWTDYGGCGGPGQQLLWSNMVYDNNHRVTHKTRPLTLSRYGGLGNHRYAHGFSGDTFQSFSTLAYEIEMTPQASNVAFGWWSHDIGGFHSGTGCPGDGDPTNRTGSELLLRWLQFGAVAPVFRTHCNHCERRIWEFPYFPAMADAMRLRNALTPYTYTWGRAAYDTGVGLLRPMYYASPGVDAAYASGRSQYMFGGDVLAAPIGVPSQSAGPESAAGGPSGAGDEWRSTPADVWIPEGTFAAWNGTTGVAGAKGLFVGPTTVVGVTYGLGDIPLFARAGTVMPMKTMASVQTPSPDPLVWTVFPGAASGSGHAYEDDGLSLGYEQGENATLSASFTAVSTAGESAGANAGDVTMTVTLHPVRGTYAGMPASRGYEVHVRCGGAAVSKVAVNGAAVPQGGGVPGWHVVTEAEHTLAAPAGTVVVDVGRAANTDTTTVAVSYGV